MERLKILGRRVIERARVSPNPVVRFAIDFARQGFRFVGLVLPGLHLGWMSSLRSVEWDGDDLVLRGWSLVRGSNHGGSPRHDVYLRRPGRPVWFGGRGARAVTRHVPNIDVLGSGARAEINYAGATWEARFPAEQLAKLSVGRWELHTKIVRDLRRSWGPVRNTYVFGTPATVRARLVGDHLIRPVSIPDGAGVFIEVGPRGIPARSVLTDGRDISIAVPAEFASALGQAVLRGTKQETVPLTAEADGDHVVLTGTLPAGKKFIDPATGVRSPARWSAFAESGAPITVDSRFFDDLLVRRAASGAIEFIDVPHHVEVESVERDGDTLRLTGWLDGDPDTFDLVLAAPRAEIPVTIDSRSDGGRFVASAPLRISSWDGPKLAPMRGAYALEGRIRGKTGDAARFTTFVSDGYIATVPTIDAGADIRLRFEVNGQPQLLIRVGRPRADDEYGAYNQRQLFNDYAMGDGAVRGTGPLDAVYFESFFGRSATCNPRAIDAEIARRRPELPRYWSVDDRSVAVPDGAIPLVIGTREWWRVRESVRWIVTNEWMRGRYVKKSFQTLLQTWHGSMYKRIGMDRGGGGQTDRARAERANWDMFVSQNGDTTPIIQQAYEFTGPDADAVLEIGYPRNDELVPLAGTAPLELVERIAEIRRRIGIPEGRRVVMYAPTWREAGQNVELLSLVELAREVGDGFVFLQRGHVRTLEEGESVASDAVIDVSTYPQINELYMVADLLITDYSSMMFDYSVTGRPMLFYTPDIEEYTDPKVRGAYFDLEEVAPGPVVRTVPEVVELLRTMDVWVPTFAERYDVWQRRFNHHDDGHASARAVDALFAFDAAKRRDTKVRRRYDPAAGEEA